MSYRYTDTYTYVVDKWGRLHWLATVQLTSEVCGYLTEVSTANNNYVFSSDMDETVVISGEEIVLPTNAEWLDALHLRVTPNVENLLNQYNLHVKSLCAVVSVSLNGVPAGMVDYSAEIIRLNGECNLRGDINSVPGVAEVASYGAGWVVDCIAQKIAQCLKQFCKMCEED